MLWIALCARALASDGADAALQEFLFSAEQFGKNNLEFNQSTEDLERLEAVLGDRARFEPLADYGPGSDLRRLSAPVGRLDILHGFNGMRTCTASIIAPDLILTNHHCIPGDPKYGPITGLNLVMGFYDGADETTVVRYVVDPSPVETNKDLDYAILRVEGRPSDRFGAVRILAEDPTPGASLMVFHHPLGRPKHVTRSNCRVPRSFTFTSDRIAHSCDTLPGSSGAPVFAELGRGVLGLHYGGPNTLGPGQYNSAKRITSILAASDVLQATTGLEPPPDAVLEGTGSGGGATSESFNADAFVKGFGPALSAAGAFMANQTPWWARVLVLGAFSFMLLRALQARMTPEGRRDIADWLLSTAERNDANALIEPFFNQFERVYGFKKRFGLVTLPSLIRSILISLGWFGAVVLLFPDLIAPIFEVIRFYFEYYGLREGAIILGVLGTILLTNAVFDWFSVTESRYILRYGRRLGLNSIGVLLFDVLATTTVSFLFFFAFLVLVYKYPSNYQLFFLSTDTIQALQGADPDASSYHRNDASTYLGFFQTALRETVDLFTGVFVKSTNEWTITDRLRFGFLFTTFSTTFWVWGFVVYSTFARGFLRLGPVSRLIQRAFDINQRPLDYIGAVIFLVVAIIFMPIAYGFERGGAVYARVVNGGAQDAVEQRRSADPFQPDPFVFSVYFDFNQFVLGPEALNLIREANARYQDAPWSCRAGRSSIELIGHADSSGEAAYNLSLSAKRANAIRAYMQFLGVDLTEISMEAVGETQPAKPTPDGVREPLNRRVDVRMGCLGDPL
ncbi:MAG: trypsin-like peptidase domain-containing protein [Pseudomonadota bacterium]